MPRHRHFSVHLPLLTDASYAAGAPVPLKQEDVDDIHLQNVDVQVRAAATLPLKHEAARLIAR